jgi:hypothetical protein
VINIKTFVSAYHEPRRIPGRGPADYSGAFGFSQKFSL